MTIAYRCTICESLIEGDMIGDGDGSGRRFAHPLCYWRREAEDANRRLAKAATDAHIEMRNFRSKLLDLSAVMQEPEASQLLYLLYPNDQAGSAKAGAAARAESTAAPTNPVAPYAVLQREALRLARDALNSLWGAGEDCLLANGPLRLDYVNSVGRHVREAVEAIDAALAKNPNPSGHTSTEASAEKSGNPGNGDAVNGGFGAGRVGTPGVELTGQRCYLAGPMRGYPQFNFPAFFAAAKSLRERGYEVWSPAENDVHQDGFDPAKDAAQPMRHYMKRDLPAVLDADFVAVLPGWERSQGATLEVTVARTCGIPVLDAATLAVAPRVEGRS